MYSWLTSYIEGLSAAEFHLQVTLLALFLGYLLYKIYISFQQFRIIADTATSNIASAAQGYIELKGLGEWMPGPIITSPLSQRRCLWYQCIIERRKSLHKRIYWQQESNQISDQLFMLQDDTGSCVILPEGAHVIPSEETVWYGNSVLQQNKNIKTRGWIDRVFSGGNYRFTERLISVAQPLYVLGQFISIENTAMLVEENGPLSESGYRKPNKYLKDFDRDNDGKIEDTERKQHIHLAAMKEVREQRQHTSLHTIQKSHEDNQPFIISALSERELLTRKSGLMMIYLTLFFTLLYVLLTAIEIYR